MEGSLLAGFYCSSSLQTWHFFWQQRQRLKCFKHKSHNLKAEWCKLIILFPGKFFLTLSSSPSLLPSKMASSSSLCNDSNSIPNKLPLPCRLKWFQIRDIFRVEDCRLQLIKKKIKNQDSSCHCLITQSSTLKHNYDC